MIHFIIGMPGETAEEVNGTLAFAFDLYSRFGAWPAVQFATPLPGTGLAKRARAAGGRRLGTALPDRAVAAGGARRRPRRSVKFKWTFDELLRASRGAEEGHHERDLRLQQPLHLLRGRARGRRSTGTRRGSASTSTPTAPRGVDMVDFDGGEPTLNPELIPLVQYARSIGYDRINVTTNGRLCTSTRSSRGSSCGRG